MANDQLASVKLEIQAMVSGRKGYRGIASAWDENGKPVIRIDIEASAQLTNFKDIPETKEGIRIMIRRVKGQIRAHSF